MKSGEIDCLSCGRIGLGVGGMSAEVERENSTQVRRLWICPRCFEQQFDNDRAAAVHAIATSVFTAHALFEGAMA